MKTAELRAKSKEELNELVLSLKKERFNLRFQEATGALESKLRFREVKKTIARAKTLLNEQQKNAAPKPVKVQKAVKPKAPKAPKVEKAATTKKASRVKGPSARKKTAKAKKKEA
jgi:large subunit ribosomal protein L29